MKFLRVSVRQRCFQHFIVMCVKRASIQASVWLDTKIQTNPKSIGLGLHPSEAEAPLPAVQIRDGRNSQNFRWLEDQVMLVLLFLLHIHFNIIFSGLCFTWDVIWLNGSDAIDKLFIFNEINTFILQRCFSSIKVTVNTLIMLEKIPIFFLTESYENIGSTTVFNIDNNQKCLLSSKSAYYYDFWRSCDTEDWSNDAENTAVHHRNKLHFIIYSHRKQIF